MRHTAYSVGSTPVRKACYWMASAFVAIVFVVALLYLTLGAQITIPISSFSGNISAP